MANIFEEVLNMIGGSGGGDVSAPNVPLPVLAQLNPELFQNVGQLNPELQSAISLGPSAMEGIAINPQARAAQMDALQKLSAISEAGGKDAQFMAEASRLQNDINANLAGQTGAIQQNLAARGMSGQEAVQRQIAAQQAANRQAQMGLDINAQAQQRALQALMSGAQLGGNIENQQFNQQSDIAKAKDMINQFNTQNLQNVKNANVGIANQAQQANLINSQDIANQNTNVRNAAQQYNLNLPQQQYQNQMQQAGMQQQANVANENRKEQRRSGNLGFAGGLLSSGAQAWGK